MSVNKVILLGNLGKDPEVRYLDENRVVASVTLATNETYTDKQGNKIKQTEWHNLELWDGLAKIAEKYLRKGKTVYVEGKIKTDQWQDKDGNPRSAKKIRVINLTMIGGSEGAPPKNEPEIRPTEPPPLPSTDDDLPF